MRDEIKTKRLILRPIGNRDAQNISTLAGDIEIARMTGAIPYPYPVISAEFFIMTNRENRRRGLCYNYAVTLRDNDQLMGVVGVFRRGENAAFELGYWLGKPYWNHGYTTEASAAILREAQNHLGVSHIAAGVFVDNPASMKVLKKLGFKSLETYGTWFSLARMERVKGLNLTLDFDSFDAKLPLQDSQKNAMRT